MKKKSARRKQTNFYGEQYQKETSKNPSVDPAGCHLPPRGRLKKALLLEEGVGVADGRRYKSEFLEMPRTKNSAVQWAAEELQQSFGVSLLTVGAFYIVTVNGGKIIAH